MQSPALASLSPPPAHYNATGGINELGQTYLTITSNRVTDSQLTTSLWLNSILGAICFMAFCILQRSVFPMHYRYRMKTQYVTVKPRPLPDKGLESYWGWLKVALKATEGEIMRSCGLDAVVMIKALSMGVKIFMPLAVIGCGVLLPIHYKYRSFDNHEINRSQLMQLTIAALPRGSKLMWVHFVLIVLYNCWVMWVLFNRYKEFVICRQHYLVRGDDPNYWIQATQQADAAYMQQKVRRILAEIDKTKDKKDDDGGEPAPPELAQSSSPQPTVRDSNQSSGIRGVVGKVGQSWSNMFTSWRGKGGTWGIHRSSLESYKPYADEIAPNGSPPVSSPLATSVGGMPSAGGACRTRSGGSQAAGCEGRNSLGDSPSGEGVLLPVTAANSSAVPAQNLSSLVIESSAAAAGSGGGHSGGSSRRWSGSSGDASEDAAALKNMGGVGDDSSRRPRMPGKQGKGRAPTMATMNGVLPAHQTINELQSSCQETSTALLGNCYSDHPWPAMPKHMRTITEDSLEYRLDSSQGNSSRPSSRGGLLGSTAGHKRESSAGTTDLSVTSPLSASNHSRTPTSALSASLAAAAADNTSLASRYSHSHSNSGGSVANGANLAVANNTMSPLSRTSSVQPAAADVPMSAPETAVLSVRVSLDSLGPCSVRTRITHNSASSRSSRDEDSSYVDISSQQSSPEPDEGPTSSCTSTSKSSNTGNGSVNTATARDISFGGMATTQQLQTVQQGMRSPGPSLLGLGCEQVHLSGLGIPEQPAAVQHINAQHAHQSSVDFSALHLTDLSRPVTDPTPDGADACSNDESTWCQHGTAGSAEGRWSPFARSGQLATSIAAAGVGNADDFWRVGVQRIPGVQSQPAQARQGSVQQLDSQRRNTDKQRFIRPEPGWRPPSETAAQQSAQGASTDSSQLQQQSHQVQQCTDNMPETPDLVPKAMPTVTVVQSSEQQPDSLLGAVQQPALSGLVTASKVPPEPATLPATRVNTGLQARAQRQRVMPRNISTGNGPSACSSSEPSPGQTIGGWVATGFRQGSKGSHSAATSHSGHSRVTSPFGASAFITPRDAGAVAGAAIGAGQELAAPHLHNALLSPIGPGMKIDPADRSHVAASMPDAYVQEEQAAYRRDCVAYDWWKPIDPAALVKYDEDGRPMWHYDGPTDALLAKPSVRFRKTINVWHKQEQRVAAVMAQHYAVLVTDVEQWPYPEMQLAHEAEKQRSFPHRAWKWVSNTLNALPQRLAGGLGAVEHWPFTSYLPRGLEEQHSLLIPHDALCMSDKHFFEVQMPADVPAMSESIDGTGGTSGGASVVVSRSSRGNGRGAISPCATSMEGVGCCAAAAVANPLARFSQTSHTTQRSVLAEASNVETVHAYGVMDQQLENALQMLQFKETPQARSQAKKVMQLQADIQSKAQEAVREQVLSREHSAYHLHPPNRSTSHLKLGPVMASEGSGYAGVMTGGMAPQAVSRNSSFRSVQHVRAEQAVAGASVGVPELSHKPQLGSSAPTRTQTPVGMRASSETCAGGTGNATDGGAAAGPMASVRTTREQQLVLQHGGLQQQWSYRESPCLMRANPEDMPLHSHGIAAESTGVQCAGLVRAATAEELSEHVAPAALQQMQSAPMMESSMATQLLQQHSQPEFAVGLQDPHHLSATAATATSGGGGHPLLLGELSLDQPLPSTGGACSNPSAAAGGSTGQGASAESAAGVPFSPAAGKPAHHDHRHLALRNSVPIAGASDAVDAAASITASLGSVDSRLNSEVRALSASMPASPTHVHGYAAHQEMHSAAAVAVPSKLRPLATAVAADSRPQSRSAGGASAGIVGVSDSYDSNASSYAARRQFVSFKPYPPDSPKACERRRQQLQEQGGVECVHGGEQMPLVPSRSSPSPAAARSISRLMGSGSSGGAFHGGPIALQEAGRSRSARLTPPGDWGGLICSSSSHQPDHLSVLIPPAQHMPISRGNTPCGSGGGLGGSAGSYGGSGGGLAPVSLPQAPWGLPPDAALLVSGNRTTFPADAVPHHGGPRHRVSAGLNHFSRWSVPGLPAACSVVNLNNVVTSPLSSNQTDGGLIPAVGGVPGNVMGVISRAGSAPVGDAVPADVKAAAALGLEVNAAEGASKPAKRGWDLVREALDDGRLLGLLQNDNYSVVTATFKRLFPRDFDKAIPVFNHKKVDGFLMQWEAAVAELERAELKQLRTGRPPTRFKGKLGRLMSCLSTAGCGCKGCRSRTELCGGCLSSHVVEVIPELQEKIKGLEQQIEKARREALNTSFTPSWFVLFKTQTAASIAASTRIYAEDNTRFQVHPAPGPEEVNWQHLWMDYKERDCRTALTWPLMLLVVLFPITLVTSAASRLEYVFCPDITPGEPVPSFVWEWYCTGKEQGSALPSFIRALFTGWLPSLLLNLWLVMVLPRMVYLIVQSEGSCFSLSALERRIGAIFYLWDVFNVFLQGTIGSTFFQQVRRIIQTPEQLPNILGAALPDSSNFFMQFIAMRALFLVWLRLCVPHGGVWQNWCHFCFCPPCCCSTCNTDRDKSLTYGPRTPRYGFEMGHILLMYLIGLAFAIVSPMLLPFSVAWFMFAWVAWRHNLNYVYQRKYESGGLMWIFMFSRIVMCMVIGQLFTFCVLVVRGAYWQAFLTIAFMPALTARFYKYCQARFARGIEYGVPLDLAARATSTSVPSHVYIPPPLQDRSWGWYPEWNKIWDGWGMPAYAAV